MEVLSGQAATLRRWLRQRPFVMLDGGLATTLETQGHDLKDALWSARLLRDDPDAIRKVHRDFLDAGAECLVTASYQATLSGLEKLGLSRREAVELLRRSISLAAEACREAAAETRAAHRALVAASVGPYGAYLADGSEYVGDYDLDREALTAFHEPRWKVLAGGCDLLACETIPSFAEAQALLDLLRQTPSVGAWFSFSCRDETRISDGTPLAECAALCADSDQVLAIGVNCTPPALIDSLLAQVARAAPGVPIVVYPNSGELYEAGSRRWAGKGSADSLAVQAADWWRAGARLIGGCCRTAPSDIRALRLSLAAAAGLS